MNPLIKKAFTLVETIIVVAIIGILMSWMTIYFNRWQEKSLLIAAEWCENSLNWELYNWIYNTMTSKVIKWWDDFISPDIYEISLKNSEKDDDRCWSGSFCDTISLNYFTNDDTGWWRLTYNDLTSKNTCRLSQWNKLAFYWSWCIIDWEIKSCDLGNEKSIPKVIRMSKWLAPMPDFFQKNFFVEDWNDDANISLDWEIIILLCFDSDCSSTKEIWKRIIDARSQTVSLHKCKFYNEEDASKCETREI